MISLSNVTLRFGERVIFDQIDWLITPGTRVGLVGNNGTGKSTLFKVILGQVIPDQGTIQIQKNRDIGYLSQEFTDLLPVSIVEYLKISCGISGLESRIQELEHQMSASPEDRQVAREYDATLQSYHYKDGYSFESKAKQVLKGLAFKDSDFEKNCLEFSDGWKRRIHLAAVLLSNPHILLLDEPTNFLDTESMEWLESFLKDFQGTIVAVVHDRIFLDKIANQIAELSRGKITLYAGNYSYFEKTKAERIEAAKIEMERQRKEIERVQGFIDRFRAKASKASQVQSRIKMLEKIDLITVESDAKKVKFSFPDCRRSGSQVLRAEGIAQQYGDRVIFSGVDVSIIRGEKLALVGVNGAGKSTLLRAISKTESPSTGVVEYGKDVVPAFYSMESSRAIQTETTIWEDVCALPSKSTTQERRNLLGAFLFSGDDIHKQVKVLSGGEKSRLALLKILLQESNFLILDEPTNHLDLATKEIFQEALLRYTGTLLLVSHDRFFLDSLVTRVLEIREGKVREYLGNYSYFIEKRGALNAPAGTVAAPTEVQPKKVTEYHKRKEDARNRRQIEKKIAALENEISELEKRKLAVEQLLCDPETHKDRSKALELSTELESIPVKVDSTYKEWHELLEQLESSEEPAPQ